MTFEDVTAQAGRDMQLAEPYRGAVIGDLSTTDTWTSLLQS